MRLEDKAVLVTGAAHRLGREIAEHLAGRGARVAIHYKASRRPALALARRLGGVALAADLADLEAVRALPGRAVEALGRLDVLVNSASVFERQPFGEVDAEGWQRHLDVNLRAPLFLAQEFVRLLPAGREGRILNLTDSRGDVMDPAYPAYSLSKAGLHAMTRGLAIGLAPRVKVLGLVLGYMLPVAGADPAKAPPPDRLVDGYAPAGTVGEAASYLLGPGDFATGSLFYLDGGRHLVGPAWRRLRGGTPP
jgi:NAD(P)-dependent dehydrogenase (short-subunit alcohol dehydrogenase family)